ncbi:MAG: RNB domain-containing ribonuclease, partial [Myxococcales bacterium]|nr:RNB domain-containing ribonuclease [Myxococcales bacterium]
MIKINKKDVLDAMSTRGMHVMEICGRLGLPKSARDALVDVLEELRSLGMIKALPGLRFRIEKKKPPHARAAGDSGTHGETGTRNEQATTFGRITVHPKGFAFIAAEDGGKDVFIPPDRIGGALQGDRVRVATRPSPKGREGAVLEITHRGLTRTTGVFRQAAGHVWLDPDDPRMRGPFEVRGEIPEDVKPGLHVVADFEDYPTRSDQNPTVRITRVLGKSGVTEVEVAKLKLRDGVVEEFPDEVLKEAEAVPNHIPKEEAAKREDLRGIDLVTIDPPDARDHDDAVWAEELKGGGFRVFVAIADVAHYVPAGSALDGEAAARAFTIYLPDRAIPMLPKEISSRMASLVPNEDRLTMAVEVELDAKGKVRKHRFIEGIMRSRARITYQGLARAMGYSDKPDPQPEAEA